ncbi:hypothetical protein PFFVO_00306 [Plasmodium falciparum Vietnam Oak-Knoll (FVO)]|uniref:DNA/RNA-binding protein Alba-like domain-containing protein n=1 Tax=Plasmodium falciparum Vietnam Oak-Knoll (FVO) TaxID=1036723 RepID=A0A024VD86_PLAFA|nr:hypothetical protein PFFVO_00306 [Plasmodium falciparum Vietnam Oak-Knoll (FVO)]
MNKNKKKKKKTNHVIVENIQKECSFVLKKENNDIYVSNNKPIQIYNDRIIKLLNERTHKNVEEIIEGDYKDLNKNKYINDTVYIHAVGINILKASYIIQDLFSYYHEFVKSIQEPTISHNKNNNNNILEKKKKKKEKKKNPLRYIDIHIECNTLIMNDNIITNIYDMDQHFNHNKNNDDDKSFYDEYDNLIKFASMKYDPLKHKYLERCKERRVTSVTIGIKKTPNK